MPAISACLSELRKGEDETEVTKALIDELVSYMDQMESSNNVGNINPSAEPYPSEHLRSSPLNPSHPAQDHLDDTPS
jgi:hypothetical protein